MHHKADSVFPKTDSLKAVIVRPTAIRPHFRGDTLEYNTAKILLRRNANVEELLARLPGLQIDASGAITYNGQKIQQLLVDGEDIFGSDPSLVTRSFDASRIARVQLLDRKSDRSSFTGVDDGSRTKTLNLVLKESSKKGYFGRVEAGANTDENYNSTGLLASFRKKEQFTALGMASNTGSLGFTGNTGNGDVRLSAIGGAVDPLGTSAGTGIPRFIASGFHYANTWNGQGDHMTGNYQFGHLFTRPLTTSRIIQTLSDTIYAQNQKSASVNRQDQQLSEIAYDWVPDTLSAFKFNFRGLYANGENQFSAGGSSSFNGILINNSQRNIQSDVNVSRLEGSLSWRIRMKRNARRVFSIIGGFRKEDHTANGYLQSQNQYYQTNGSPQSRDSTDQRKVIDTKTIYAFGGLNYTEPLSKTALLAFSYGFSFSNDRPVQSTYNKIDGKYVNYVDSLSSDLRQQTLDQRYAVNLQGGFNGLGYIIGGTVQNFDYRQHDLLMNSFLNKQYLSFVPRVLLNYRKTPSTGFTFSYIANTQLPSSAQLQTVRNNSDPLHITLGNPNLRPGYIQAVRFSFQRLETWMIAVNLGFKFNSNSISNRTITDSLGRQITQPVNVDGGRNADLSFSLSKRLIGVNAAFHCDFNYTRDVSFINSDLSQNDTYAPGGGFSLDKQVANKYDLRLNTQFTYFENHISVNSTVSNHYWTQSHSGILTIYLLKNYELNTNAVYTWQQSTNNFTGNSSVMLWNAGVSRNFLDGQLVLRMQVNNLLNKNSGISRTNVGNVNTETSTKIPGRYWMLSITYRFDHKQRDK